MQLYIANGIKLEAEEPKTRRRPSAAQSLINNPQRSPARRRVNRGPSVSRLPLLQKHRTTFKFTPPCQELQSGARLPIITQCMQGPGTWKAKAKAHSAPPTTPQSHWPQRVYLAYPPCLQQHGGSDRAQRGD